MTDYFALLEQPRRPWLDREQLKEIFHARTMLAHPDAMPDSPNESSFAELNEAYQVLRDPKRRLHHLLSLEGNPPPRSSSVPPEIASLFPLVAELTHRSEALLRRIAEATSTLSRSLLKAEALSTGKQLEKALGQLQQLHDGAEARLKNANDSREQQSELSALYLEFSYLTKWSEELREKQLRLNSAF